MNTKRLDRGMKFWLILWSGVLVAMVTSEVQDCGDGNITIHIDGNCTSSTCIGECRNEETCCLEKCFTGNQPNEEELTGCIEREDARQGCRSFENQTACLADNMNKTFEVCWRHSVYFISTHPEARRIKGFNPIHCPCDVGSTRKPGSCSFSQCADSSLCEEKTDFILDTDVCCLHQDIFPRESDCDETEVLDDSVHHYLNVSTVVQCQELCQGGLCKMPNATRLPACCRKRAEPVEGKSGGGLHGGVVAVIVIIIIVLILVAIFGVFYLYRIKKDEALMKVAIKSQSSIEVTGIEEIIEQQNTKNEDGATYTDMYNNHVISDRNKYGQSETAGFRRESMPDFTAPIHSLDKLQNGDVHEYENRGYSYDNEGSEEEQSYNYYRRRRTGSTISDRLGTSEDNIEYVFDDGRSNVSDDNDELKFGEENQSSNNEDEDEDGV